jgi:hypothetical protein
VHGPDCGPPLLHKRLEKGKTEKRENEEKYGENLKENRLED